MQDSALLVNPTWDAKEREKWLQKVEDEKEKEALLLNLKKFTITAPTIPEILEKLVLSKYESVCLDLSNLLNDETWSLQGLSKDMSGMGFIEIFDAKKIKVVKNLTEAVRCELIIKAINYKILNSYDQKLITFKHEFLKQHT